MNIKRNNLLLFLGLIAISTSYSESSKFSDEQVRPEFESQRTSSSQPSAIDHRDEVRLTHQNVTPPSERFLKPSGGLSSGNEVAYHSSASRERKGKRKNLTIPKLTKRISEPHPLNVEKNGDDPVPQDREPKSTSEKMSDDSNATDKSVEIPETYKYDSVRITEKQNNNSSHNSKRKIKKRPKFNPIKKSEVKSVISPKHSNDWLVSNERSEDILVPNVTVNQNKTNPGTVNKYIDDEKQGKGRQVQNSKTQETNQTLPTISWENIEEQRKPKLEAISHHNSTSLDESTEKETESGLKMPSNTSPFEKNKKRQKKIKRLRKRLQNKNSTVPTEVSSNSTLVTEEKLSNDTTLLHRELQKDSLALNRIQKETDKGSLIDASIDRKNHTEIESSSEFPFVKSTEYSEIDFKNAQIPKFQEIDRELPTEHKFLKDNLKPHNIPENTPEIDSKGNGYYLLSFNYKGEKAYKPKDIIKLSPIATVKELVKKAHTSQEKKIMSTKKQTSERGKVTHTARKQQETAKEKHPHVKKFDFSKRHKLHPDEDDVEVRKETTEPEIYENYGDIKKVNKPVVNFKRKTVKKSKEPLWKPSKSEVRSPEKKYETSWDTDKAKTNRDNDHEIHFVVKNNDRSPYPNKKDNVPWTSQKPSNPKENFSSQLRDIGAIDKKTREYDHVLRSKKKSITPSKENGKYYIHMFKKVGDFSLESHDPSSDTISRNDGYMSSIKLRWNDDDRRAQVETSVDSRMQPFELIMKHDDPFSSSDTHTVSLGVTKQEVNDDVPKKPRIHENVAERQSIRKSVETETIYRRKRSSNDRNKHFFTSHFVKGAVKPVVNSTYEKTFPYSSLIQNQDRIHSSESSFNPQMYSNSNKRTISQKDMQNKHPEIRSYYLKPSSAEEAKKFASEFRDEQFIKSFPFSAYQKPARQRETKKVEIFRAYQLPNRPPQHKSNPINFYNNAKEVKHIPPLPRNTNVRSLTYPRKNITKTFNSGLNGSSETKIAKSVQPNFNNNKHDSNETKYLHGEREPKISRRENPFVREIFSVKTKLNLEIKPAANERIPIRREFYHKFKHLLRPNLRIQNQNGDLNSRDKIYEKDNFHGRPDLAGKDELIPKTIAHDFIQQAGSQQLQQLPSTNFGSYLRSKDRGSDAGKTKSIKRVNQLEDNYGLHEYSDNYPRYNSIPKTHFTCNEHKAGYYADPETGCQVFHLCQGGGEKHSFLCPNKTLFNQLLLVCDWHNKVNCEESVSFYNVNDRIYRQHSAPKEYRNTNHNYDAGFDNNYHNRNSQQSRSTFKPDRKRGIEKLTSETILHGHHDSSEALETRISLPNSSTNDDQIDADSVLIVEPESDAKLPWNDTLQSNRKPVYHSISDSKSISNDSSFKNNTSNPKGFHYYKEDEYLILHDIPPPQNNISTSPKRFEHEIKDKKTNWNPVKLRKSTYEQSIKEKGKLRQNKPIDHRDISIKKTLYKKYSKPVNYETEQRSNPTKVKYGFTKEQEEYLPTFKKPEKKNISLTETSDKYSVTTESIKSKPSKHPLTAQHIKRKPLFPQMILKTKNVSVSKSQTMPLRSEAITKENKKNVQNHSGKLMKTPQVEVPRHAISNQNSEYRPKTPKTSEKYKNHKTDETNVDLVYKYPLSINIKKNNSSDQGNFGQRKNDSKIIDFRSIQLPHFEKPVNNEEETNKKHHVERKNVDQHIDVSSRIADIFSGIKTIGVDVSKILDNKDSIYKNIQITKSLPIPSEAAQKVRNISLEPFTFDKLLPKTLKVQSKGETIETSRTPVQTVPKFFQDINAEINTKVHMKNVLLDKDQKEFSQSKPSNYETSATRNNETVTATDLQTDMKVANRMNEYNRNGTSVINEFHPITSNSNVQSHKNDNESERIFSSINIDSKQKSSINGFSEAYVRQPIHSSQYPYGYTDQTVSVSKVLYIPSESKENSKGIQYAQNPKEQESEILKTVSNPSTFRVQKYKESDLISTSVKPTLNIDPTPITPSNSFQRSQPIIEISPTFAISGYNNLNLNANQNVHESPENKDYANGKFLTGARGRHSYMKSLPRRTSKSHPSAEKHVPERQPKKQTLPTQENLPAFIFSANPFSKHKILGQNTKTSQNEPLLNHKPTYKTTLPSREHSKPPIQKNNHPPQSENNDSSSSSECDESNSRESAELSKTIQLGKNGPYYNNIKIVPVRSHPSGRIYEFIGGKVVRKSPTKQDDQKTSSDGCQNNQGNNQMKQDIVNLEIPQTEQVSGTTGRNPINGGYKNSPQSDHQNSGKYVPLFASNPAINGRNNPGNQQGTVNSEFSGGRQVHLEAKRPSSSGRHTLSDQQTSDKLSPRLKSKSAIEGVLKEQGQLKRPIKLFETQKKYERVPVTEIAYPNGGTYQNGSYNRPSEPASVALDKTQNKKSSSEESTENIKTSKSRGTEGERNSKYASIERAAELEAERMIQSRSPS